MNPCEYINRRLDECEPSMPFRAETSEGITYWQVRLRAELCELLGVPRWTGPLAEELRESVQSDGYRRESVTFQSRPSLPIGGYMLVPDGLAAPRPAVLCLHGHGPGAAAIVGLADDGGYEADFALQCVRHGYPTLAIDQFSFGERSTIGNREASCHRDSTAALALGETMTGWRVWDAIRGIDYLRTRPEVDPDRIAVMGISGGGLTTLFTAALDTRVHTAVVSGYFNTFRDSILSVMHCVDNYVPGLQRLVEMPDLAGLVAPRRLFVEGGTQDDIFPIAAFRRAVARAESIYDTFGVPRNFGFEEFEGEHQFWGKGAFEFLRQVAAPGTAAPENPVE